MLSECCVGTGNPVAGEYAARTSACADYAGGKRETWNLIKTEAWAEDVFNKLKERTEAYTRLTDVQPTWLLSRLAMFISVNRKVGRIRLV